jgi:hypothetical protein
MLFGVFRFFEGKDARRTFCERLAAKLFETANTIPRLKVFIVDREFSNAMIIAGESNPKLGLIRVHTPVAQALLGSALGAEVLARLPGGLKKLKVLAIQKHSIAHPAVSIPAF